MSSKIGVYGPRVIGEAAFTAEQQIVKTKSNIYGPRVLGTTEQQSSTPPAGEGEGGADSSSHLSIDALIQAVETNPATFERFVAAELAREPKPRKGALSFLLEFEKAHENRAEWIASIEAGLTSLGGN